MIALILGGAPSVWSELEAARALLGRRHILVAANLAGIEVTGPLAGWASLHPDNLATWLEKSRRTDCRIFSPAPVPGVGRADLVDERWPGSSGLYALQCALFEMGTTAAILCGIPMDQDAGHFISPGAWAGTADYRQAFATALPLIGGRVRSMGGWTAAVFGAPTPEWIDAVDNITPLGVSASPGSRTMHKVTNNSKGTHSFWARNPDGTDKRVHLQPGESEVVEVEPSQFDGTDVAAEAVEPEPEPAPAPKPKTNPKPKTRPPIRRGK